jgi:hypothetical protein
MVRQPDATMQAIPGRGPDAGAVVRRPGAGGPARRLGAVRRRRAARAMPRRSDRNDRCRSPMTRLVSVAKRIKALQIACFLAFVRTIFLVIYVCVLSHVRHEAC